LVLNEAGALNTNTIHGVKLTDADRAPQLAAGFLNSLTLLSAELCGRSYGGGVLKLEPSEAEALLIPPTAPALASELPQIDSLLRAGKLGDVLDLVDSATLGAQGLDLSDQEIGQLRDSRERLCARRHARGKTPRSV
jgi:hypothetical protein